MLRLNNRLTRNRFFSISILCAAVMLVPALRAADILYIGDGADNTVKRFDAATGKFLSTVVSPGSAGLLGPRGIIINPFPGGNLIVVNQNVNQNFAGEILEYSATDGQFIAALVPCNKLIGRQCEKDAPFAPRGIVHGQNGAFFVAEIGKSKTGSVEQFDDQTGDFRGDLDFGQFALDNHVYSPRSVVFGPDGMLYVSIFSKVDPLVGFILRFKDGRFFDVFASNMSCLFLHRPEGLAFGPDGKLYVTSFRGDPSVPDDFTDKILVFNRDGSCSDSINLDAVGADRTFAMALLFGPGGRLFVPISNTGEVRRYNVLDKTYTPFVPVGGPLLAPWYLTFGKTDPSTLAYKP